MKSLHFLNKKEVKKILSLVKEQFDSEIVLEYEFLVNEKNKVYIVNKDIAKIDLTKLRVNSIGLYFGELHPEGLRLSIEGSQLIGPTAKKNVLELNEKELKEWIRGEDLVKEVDVKGFVIIKHADDFFGCGKIIQGKILNHYPKVRRINLE